MGRTFTPSKLEVDAKLRKIREARDDERKLSERRMANFNAYIRKPWGNEEEGRSEFQASDVMNQVETIFPNLQRGVLASDHKITIEGPEKEVSEGFRIKCREVIHDCGAWTLYCNALKDGLININGTIKIWWMRKYKKTIENAQDLGEDQAAQLQGLLDAGEIHDLQLEEHDSQELTISTPTGPEMQILPPKKFKATVTVLELERSEPMIRAMPAEEFLVERGKAQINDRRGCGHQTRILVGEFLQMAKDLSTPTEPFFVDMVKAIKQASSVVSTGNEDEERRNRQDFHFQGSDASLMEANLTPDEARRELMFCEWTDYVIDSAGTLGDPGALVFSRLWFAGDVLVRCEENEDGIVPFCTWTPYPLPHSIHGMSVAENHVHDQHSHSAFGRSLIDHVALSVDGEVYITNEGTDIIGLRRRKPGQLVYATPEKDFYRPPPTQIDAKLFQAMAWLKTEGEERGPGNRWLQGGNVDPRNTTATGQTIMARASMSKQDTIAMCFSETFQVDLYNKLIKLMQQNLETLEVMIQGKPMKWTNEQIQGDYKARSAIGMNYDWDDSEFNHAMALEQSAMALAQVYPMLYPLRTVYEHRKKVYQAAGVQNINDYISPPPPGMENWFPGMPMPGQAPPGMPGMPPQAGPGGPGGPQLQIGSPDQGMLSAVEDRDMAPAGDGPKMTTMGGV